MRAQIVVALAAAFCAAASGAASANGVGDVESVERSAYGTPPNTAKEAKRKGDPIAFQELLETLEQSGMLVRFSDGSKLTLGADSRLLVDNFVYDPNQADGTASGQAVISIPVGALRYVTGAMPKGHTTIDTPTATMILRGTNVIVGVTPQGATHLTVDEGSVSVHSKATGQDTLVNAGDSVDITVNGIAISDENASGDPLVDDGFVGDDINGEVEHRRGADSGHHENPKSDSPSKGNSGRTGGSGGGSTPG